VVRATKNEKSKRLNAAFVLLSRGCSASHAVAALAAEFSLSERQASRYLQEAQKLKHPVSIVAQTIPITIKLPEDVAVALRAYAQASGLSIGDIVACAVLRFLAKARRYG
jgi:uncharacterized protein YueI